MNIKNYIAMIALAGGLMVSGFVYGDETEKKGTGDSATTDGKTNMGWQEGTIRSTVLYCDGLRINAGPSVGTSGVSWSIGVSSNFTLIECCRPASVKQSWCNFAVDDVRCAD